MADGSSKPIEEVRAGDRVASADERTGEKRASTVTAAWSAVVPETLRLTFADGSLAETTALHPFYVSGQGWVPAGRLALGTSIVTRAGPPLALAASERVAGERTVYNIEVARTRTYYVLAGDEDLYVHNAKASKTLRRQWEEKYGRPWPKQDNGDNYECDHIIPKADGGADHVDNVQPLTYDEHRRKHAPNWPRWGRRGNPGQ